MENTQQSKRSVAVFVGCAFSQPHSSSDAISGANVPLRYCVQGLTAASSEREQKTSTIKKKLTKLSRSYSVPGPP